MEYTYNVCIPGLLKWFKFEMGVPLYSGANKIKQQEGVGKGIFCSCGGLLLPLSLRVIRERGDHLFPSLPLFPDLIMKETKVCCVFLGPCHVLDELLNLNPMVV